MINDAVNNSLLFQDQFYIQVVTMVDTISEECRNWNASRIKA